MILGIKVGEIPHSYVNGRKQHCCGNIDHIKKELLSPHIFHRKAFPFVGGL
jgi:hypothetical protein